MPSRPPLYVGYLRLPERHRRFVVGVAVVFVCLLAAAGGGVALSQRDPGDAVWDTGMERTWTGVVRMEPYPMLVGDDGSASLIVGMGKFAVRDRVAPFDGMACEVRGFALAREHRRMIELSMDDDAIRALPGAPVPAVETAPVGAGENVVVIGEIVDGKCYLGAMKPGDGKAHKACAVLCISGGLPPLVAADVPGAGRLYPLLLVDGAAVLPGRVLEVVGEPVRIEGRLLVRHGFPVLETSVGGISRVGRSVRQSPPAERDPGRDEGRAGTGG
ncbi:MAG: hypothetical protein HND58_10930 [Planctomycetota bacterium]|nr:MAG: hypothetical protein HND58_10930 [Planctomycetota bacterium]